MSKLPGCSALIFVFISVLSYPAGYYLLNFVVDFDRKYSRWQWYPILVFALLWTITPALIGVWKLYWDWFEVGTANWWDLSLGVVATLLFGFLCNYQLQLASMKLGPLLR